MTCGARVRGSPQRRRDAGNALCTAFACARWVARLRVALVRLQRGDVDAKDALQHLRFRSLISALQQQRLLTPSHPQQQSTTSQQEQQAQTATFHYYHRCCTADHSMALGSGARARACGPVSAGPPPR